MCALLECVSGNILHYSNLSQMDGEVKSEVFARRNLNDDVCMKKNGEIR